MFSKKNFAAISFGNVIYAKFSIDNLNERGIVGLEKGIDKLYKERKKLYEKYSDIIIDTEKFDLEKITSNIIRLLSNFERTFT